MRHDKRSALGVHVAARLQSPSSNDCTKNFSCRYAVQEWPELERTVQICATENARDGSALSSGAVFPGAF
jgi:hypothetical protein